MAKTNFIPTVWSEVLYRELDRRCVGAANSWRVYEGDIREKGDRARVCGIDPMTVFDYSKNTDFGTMQELSSNSRDLVINQAKAFNFQIDDVDRVQASPKLMELAMSEAASALASAADDYIYSLWEAAPTAMTVSADGVTESDIVDVLLAAREKLSLNNVSQSDEVSLEISPAVATKVLKAHIAQSTDNKGLMSGEIGTFLGMKLYVTGGIAQDTENGKVYHKCFARTKRAIAYASQLSSVEAYRPEKRFADAVKGLHLYGAKLIYPKELAVVSINLG